MFYLTTRRPRWVNSQFGWVKNWAITYKLSYHIQNIELSHTKNWAITYKKLSYHIQNILKMGIQMSAIKSLGKMLSWFTKITQSSHPKNPTMHHFVTEMSTPAHFCYKVVHCGIWDWCTVGFPKQVDSAKGPSVWRELTHWGLVTPYVNKDLGHPWFR